MQERERETAMRAHLSRHKLSSDEVDQQRMRADWKHSRGNFNPTTQGFIAGAKDATVTCVISSVAMYGLHKRTKFIRKISTGGKVWLISAMTLGSFFIASEQAVVGEGAREKAAARAEG